MNLVQINERLKDLPLQAVQQYANGMNPEVPPYLALSELQRRQAQQQQMSNAQGQGPMPSVKEQIEQKAGLLALQQAQMQQQQQQMMQPRPGPVPAGIPQAEPQPQAMYGGGLARIPVRDDMYQFAGGGIIAFQDGGWLDRLMKSNLTDAEKRRRARLEAEAEEGRINPTRAEEARIRAMEEVVRQRSPNVTQETMERVGMAPRQEIPDQPVVGGAPIAQGYVPRRAAPQQPEGIVDLAGARSPAARPAQPAPQQQMPQLPQQPTTSPLMQEALAAAREKPVAPTPKSIKEGIAALAPQAMTEEAMQKRAAEQRARAARERAAFERTRPSGLDDLIRVFGQAGQYKGLSGTGPAYTAMQQQKRAEELAMEKRQNELLTAIEGRETKEAGDLFGARTAAMEKAQQSYQNRLAANTKALADIAGVDQRRIDEALNRLNRTEVAKLQAATANRPTEAERIEAKYLALKAQGKTEEAEKYLDTISRIKGGGAAGVGAGRNAIMERRLDMQNLEKIMKDEAMQYSEEEKREAAREYRRLAMLNTRETGGAASAGPQSGGVDKNNPLLK